MRAEDAFEIRQLQLFCDCEEGTFASLIEAGFLQRFPSGVELIHENDPADFLYIVVEGLVEMFAAHNGRETTIGFVQPLGTFILAAVLRDQVYLQSARTLDRSRVLMIPAAKIRSAIARDNAFMSAIVDELAMCYRGVVKDLKNQKLRTGSERLANWILKNHRHQGSQGSVEIKVEKRILAARLGMTPESLSRAFVKLGPYGIDVAGPTIRIDRLDDLEKFACPTLLIDDRAS